MDTKGGKRWWGGCGGVMNWAIGIDMYTLMCIKLMNKNLLYKKIYIYIIQVKKIKNTINKEVPTENCHLPSGSTIMKLLTAAVTDLQHTLKGVQDKDQE